MSEKIEKSTGYDASRDLKQAASGVRDGDVVATFGLSRAAAERMMESCKAYRSRLNHKIAWCCVLPPLGWFGRWERLEQRRREVSAEVHKFISMLAIADTSDGQVSPGRAQ